jgi:hypothetical protein
VSVVSGIHSALAPVRRGFFTEVVMVEEQIEIERQILALLGGSEAPLTMHQINMRMEHSSSNLGQVQYAIDTLIKQEKVLRIPGESIGKRSSYRLTKQAEQSTQPKPKWTPTHNFSRPESVWLNAATDTPDSTETAPLPHEDGETDEQPEPQAEPSDPGDALWSESMIDLDFEILERSIKSPTIRKRTRKLAVLHRLMLILPPSITEVLGDIRADLSALPGTDD